MAMVTPNQIPTQFTAPVANEYGGDEVSALVLDPGSWTTRAGFAGEDTPKSVVSTYYGTVPTSKDLLFGENRIHYPSPGIEIKNPYNKDGIVDDWDTAAKLWEYTVTSRLTGSRATPASQSGLSSGNGDEDGDVQMEDVERQEKPMADAPLLVTEPCWNPAKAREKAIEIAMEDWGVPAFWSGRQGAMSAFSAGKATALVIDIGASTMSVTPVAEGMILKKGVQRSALGGNWVSDQIRIMFAQQAPHPVTVTPHFMVQSKTAVDAGSAAQAVLKKFEAPLGQSFRWLQEERVVTEFKESVVQVWEGPGRLGGMTGGIANEDVARGQPSRPFEMPDGWNQVFGVERYKVIEGLFDAKAAFMDSSHPAPQPSQTLPHLIQQSLNACDADLRPVLLHNVVIVGSGTLVYGMTRRINMELDSMFPAPRVRLFSPGNLVERKFSSWIGGSILASLGSFHQMWISQKEYEEHGSGIVEKRCK